MDKKKLLIDFLKEGGYIRTTGGVLSVEIDGDVAQVVFIDGWVHEFIFQDGGWVLLKPKVYINPLEDVNVNCIILDGDYKFMVDILEKDGPMFRDRVIALAVLEYDIPIDKAKLHFKGMVDAGLIKKVGFVNHRPIYEVNKDLKVYKC